MFNLSIHTTVQEMQAPYLQLLIHREGGYLQLLIHREGGTGHVLTVGVLVRRYRADTLPLIEGAVQAGQ